MNSPRQYNKWHHLSWISLILALLITSGCSTVLNKSKASKSNYYEQVVSLLDPSNPVPQISAKTILDAHPKQIGDVKVGMTMAEVISLWGKPKALGINSARINNLKYGEFGLTFSSNTLSSFWMNYDIAKSNQPSACVTNHVSSSFASAYYENLHSIFTTNRIKYRFYVLGTNSVIPADKLKKGELGKLRLGMTISDTVAALGKPPYFCRFTTNYAVLYYGDGLRFEGNSLTSIPLYISTNEPIRFDNGVTGKDTISHFIKVFGVPLSSYSYNGGHHLYYRFGDVYVHFVFNFPDSVKNMDSEQDKAVLRFMCLLYHGYQVDLIDADTKLINSIAYLLGIDSSRIQSLRSLTSLNVIIPMLEKEMGKPLTVEQSKKVESALQVRDQARSKIYESNRN